MAIAALAELAGCRHARRAGLLARAAGGVAACERVAVQKAAGERGARGVWGESPQTSTKEKACYAPSISRRRLALSIAAGRPSQSVSLLK